ncbi:WD-40 repeat-containing protein [Reticulomyxa filosa]|uniref:WD-40 repeat-containing protein n=1 Tax=Reticulomyxa filosa TaxID=46433 RepID=X6MLW2_RETFI|nr:WD-40 repeat-containing protein [Reticulomyxa filosa]|eukprot:ETO14839.1 WD-40 repeat-containing protein [Reticulomyxa filosa]
MLSTINDGLPFVEEWKKGATEKEKQLIAENEEKGFLIDINIELDDMNEGLSIKRLQVKNNKFVYFFLVECIRTKEITKIIHYWVKLSSIKKGWVNDFNIIILRYVLRKYFKLSQIFQIHSNHVTSVDFSPNGTQIVSTSRDNTIRIWDINLGKEAQVLIGHSSSVNDAHFSPDGNIIASCSDDNTIRLWDTRSWKEIKQLEGHFNCVKSVQFSPNGKNIASGSLDGTVRIWDVKSGQELKLLITDDSDEMHCVQFSPDGRLICGASSENITIWDVESREIMAEWEENSGDIQKIQFFPDCSSMVICSDEIIRIWDLMSITKKKELKALRSVEDIINDVKFFPDDQHTIVSCSNTGSIQLWDVKLGVEIQKLKYLKQIIGVTISPDGNTLVSCAADGTIQLWETLWKSSYKRNHQIDLLLHQLSSFFDV